jgi:phosphoribosylanthranilate isomerase
MTEEKNLQDVSRLKPDYLGFIFYSGSKRLFTGESSWLHSLDVDVIRVGVFVNHSIEYVLESMDMYGLKMAQLHGDESVELCEELKAKGKKVMKAFQVDESFAFTRTDRFAPYSDFFLFDTLADSYGGSGRKFNWELLDNYTGNTPFFLSGGIGPDDAAQLKSLRHPMLYGIDVNSRFESSPGIKRIDPLKRFIMKIRENEV